MFRSQVKINFNFLAHVPWICQNYHTFSKDQNIHSFPVENLEVSVRIQQAF